MTFAVLKTWALTAIESPALTACGVAVTLVTSAVAGVIETTVETDCWTTPAFAVTSSVKKVLDWIV